MRSERVVIDTNILLYILAGDEKAHALVQGREVVLSSMVRMEAMVYHGGVAGHLDLVQRFIDRCAVEEIHRGIQDRAVALRLRHKLKLPDAIIAATAVHLGLPLISADTIFSKLEAEHEFILYKR